MVLSYEWQELHLTPSGWEEGTFKVDSGYQKEVIPPKDRVLTIRIEETIDAPFQEIETDISEIWRSSDDKLINELLAKFGTGPESIEFGKLKP